MSLLDGALSVRSEEWKVVGFSRTLAPAFSELALPEYRELQTFSPRTVNFGFATAEKSSKDVLICSSKKGRFILADLLPEDCRLLGVSATLEISNRVPLADLLGFPDVHLLG